MQRAVWTAALLLVPVLSGCFGLFADDPEPRVVPPDVGYDATSIQVADVAVHEVTIESFDGVGLAAVVYEPIAAGALPDGREPMFPAVVFVHDWGTGKEMWQDLPVGDGPLPLPVDLLQEFAEAGIIVVAYDARGFGRSGGLTTAAGFAEQGDLERVLDFIEASHRTNGRFGVTGIGYGGGHAFLAWAHSDRVVTAVPHAGWTDLYNALVPGNVPKLQWMQALYLEGLVGSGARMHGSIHEWYLDSYFRSSSERIQTEMDTRSILDAAHGVDKPLMTCQGLHDSLYTQAHEAWANTPGFVYASYYPGGHGTLDRACWDRTLDWFLFFLAGIDTGVGAWPSLQTVDIRGGDLVEYQEVPRTVIQQHYLKAPVLSDYPAANATFTVQQRLLANPFTEPSGLWDLTGRPHETIPTQLRQDPTGVFFTVALLESQVILGAPRLVLQATNETADGPFQVAATLFHESTAGSRLLGRAAYAVLEDAHHDDGVIVLQFPWTKADIGPAESITLKVASNDPSVFMPLFADYSVTFDGTSYLDLPLFAPS